jgi:hypothetical protein
MPGVCDSVVSVTPLTSDLTARLGSRDMRAWLDAGARKC